MTATTNGPVFILGASRSNAPLLCAMLGQHPEFCGLPELNLFVADSMDAFWIRFAGPRQFMRHGLLRAVAQFYGGEQTPKTVDFAIHWCQERMGKTTAEIHRELCDKVGPRTLVDASPTYASNPEALARMQAAFPNACYIHLVRHPLSQGKAMLKLSQLELVATDSMDYSTEPPTIDPQISWYRTQVGLLSFLKNVPPARQRLVRVEDFLNAPELELPTLCKWLGVAADEVAMDEMLHPERSPFAHFGPIGANLGNDPNFLRAPEFMPGAAEPLSLVQPLPWRMDGRGFFPEVVQLASRLGYRESEHGDDVSSRNGMELDDLSAALGQGGFELQRATMSANIHKKRAYVHDFLLNDPSVRNATTVHPSSATPEQKEQRLRELEYRRTWLFAMIEETNRELGNAMDPAADAPSEPGPRPS